jgi:hypothetical protein
MVASCYIKETNLVGAVVTPAVGTGSSITNSNMGILDTPSTTLATAYAIPANSYSYEKWQRLQVYANAAPASTIQNVKVWETGTLPGADTHKIGTVQAAAYRTPIITISDIATLNMTSYTTEGTAFPVPIGGTSTPTSDTVGYIATVVTAGSPARYTDYVVHQIHVDTATTSGPTSALTMYWQYDEYSG